MYLVDQGGMAVVLQWLQEEDSLVTIHKAWASAEGGQEGRVWSTDLSVSKDVNGRV